MAPPAPSGLPLLAVVPLVGSVVWRGCDLAGSVRAFAGARLAGTLGSVVRLGQSDGATMGGRIVRIG